MDSLSSLSAALRQTSLTVEPGDSTVSCDSVVRGGGASGFSVAADCSPAAVSGGAGRALSDTGSFGGGSLVTATTDSFAKAVFGGAFGASAGAARAATDEKVKIAYTEAMDEASLIGAISEIDHPHVFFWYIGSHGFKKGSMDFYRQMISRIATGKNEATCHLYDMTAWGALTNPKTGLNKKSSSLEKIDSLVANVKTVASSVVFARMKSITEPSMVEYFNSEILRRPFLLMPSLDHSDVGVKVGDVMGPDSLILKDIHGMDTSKAYSILQYVEGLILTEMAMLFSLEERLKDDRDFNIVFALPNDESKYYRDEEGSFAKDLSRYLGHVFGDRLDGKTVNIKFCNFSYGEEPFHRPYNAPGAIVKAKDVVFENVLVPELFPVGKR